MGMLFRRSNSGESLHAWVGPKVPAGSTARFVGNKMRGPTGAKNYTHLNFVRKGDYYVSRPRGESLYRARGSFGEKEFLAILKSQGQTGKLAARLSATSKASGNTLVAQRANAIRLQQISRDMVRASRSTPKGLNGEAARAMGRWRSAASSAESLARSAASANETAMRLSARAAEASAKAAAAQAEVDAKIAAAAAEQASKAAARTTEAAAKQAMRTAEALARTAAKATEAAVRAAAVATEVSLRAAAAVTEAAVTAAAYTAAAAAAVVGGALGG